MNEWISVEDSEPENDAFILVYDGNIHTANFRINQDMGYYRYDCDTYDVTPTHWMTLPEPPTI